MGFALTTMGASMPKRAKSGSRGRKTRRRRDYPAEYSRRAQRGVAKGLSLSVARGHARAGERPKPTNRKLVNPKSKEELAIKVMKGGFTLRDAARGFGLSEQHLRRYIKENIGATRVGNQWVLDDQRARRFPFYSNRTLVAPWLKPYEASSASLYMHARRQFPVSGDMSVLEPYAGQGVKDIYGKFYPFEVDPNALYELASAGEPDFPEIYKITNN
jgi:hypothetical protein